MLATLWRKRCSGADRNQRSLLLNGTRAARDSTARFEARFDSVDTQLNAMMGGIVKIGRRTTAIEDRQTDAAAALAG